jgi:hypothetical protein
MGIFDAIKDLLGSSGVGDLVESTGIADQLGGITEAVQAPIEEFGTAATDVTEAVQAPIEEFGTAATDVTEAIDPLTGQL